MKRKKGTLSLILCSLYLAIAILLMIKGGKIASANVTWGLLIVIIGLIMLSMSNQWHIISILEEKE